MKALLLFVVGGCTVAGATQDWESLPAIRAQIAAERYAAGLSKAQFWAEIRLLNRTWWTAEMRREEALNAGPEHLRGDSTVRMPEWPALWPERHLLTRATMLGAGRSESEAVQSAADADAYWFFRWRRIVADWPELAMGVDPVTIREPRMPGPPKRAARY